MKHNKYILVSFSVMFGLLSCIHSNDPGSNLNAKSIDTIINKTIIVDVRTVEEWMNDGHASCSVNFPVDEIDSKIESLRPYAKIIVVCRSGSRAGIAKGMLEKAGIKNVENAGAWQNIACK